MITTATMVIIAIRAAIYHACKLNFPVELHRSSICTSQWRHDISLLNRKDSSLSPPLNRIWILRYLSNLWSWFSHIQAKAQLHDYCWMFQFQRYNNCFLVAFVDFFYVTVLQSSLATLRSNLTHGASKLFWTKCLYDLIIAAWCLLL